jgi:hypothetical protein
LRLYKIRLKNFTCFQRTIVKSFSSAQSWESIPGHFLYIHFIFSILFRKSLIFLKDWKLQKSVISWFGYISSSRKRGVTS